MHPRADAYVPVALQRQNKADLARAAARVEEAEQAAGVTGRQLAGANTDLKVCQG